MSGWRRATLGDVFEIARGGSPRPIEKFVTDDPAGYNWIMIGDAVDGSKYISSTKKRIRREGLAKSRMVHEEDFLLTNSMSFGRPYILKTSGCIHDGWLVLSPREENVHPDFFYYLLGSDLLYREFSKRAAGAVVKNLNTALVRSVEIVLPPLAEQKRIAGILDAADALRAKRREALAHLDTLLQSTFLDMFGDPVTNPMGWTVATVGDEISFLTSGSRGWAKYYSESGDVFIRIQNLRAGRLDLEDIAFITAPASAEATRTRVRTGDVLLSITADLGRTAVVPPGIGKAHINQHLAILRFVEIDPVFVSYQLASEGGQSQFKKLNREGVKAGLNFDDVRRIALTKPPLALQRRFAAIVESVERQKVRMRAHLAELDALFASLQSRAFSGTL